MIIWEIMESCIIQVPMIMPQESQPYWNSQKNLLISKILNEVSKSKASKLSEFDRNIASYIKEEFEPIEKNIMEKANKVSEILIENFFNEIAEPLNVLEHKLKKDEKSLQDRIASFEENEINKDELTLKIHKKIKKLEMINKGLKA